MKNILKIIIVLIIWVGAIYFFLKGASQIIISPGCFFEDAILKYPNPLSLVEDAILKYPNPLSMFFHQFNIPFPKYNVLRVKELNIIHAIRNLIFLISTAGIYASFSFVGFIAGIVGIIYGLTSSSWDFLLNGIGMIILMPLFGVISGCLGSLLMWFALLFQSCTPGYFLIMVIVGIPFLLIGFGTGAAPTITIIKIYHG